MSALLAANAVVGLVLAAFEAMFAMVPVTLTDPFVVLAFVLASFVFVLLRLLTIPTFIAWLRRVRINVDALGASGLTYGPGWAIGGFFLPIANLYVPARIASEVHAASDPRAVDTDLDWLYRARSPVSGLWWGSWIAANLLAWHVRRTDEAATLEATTTTAFVLGAVSSGLAVLSAVFGIALVQSITARQAEKHRRLAAARPAPPAGAGDSSQI